jgi:hypothetical protein
MPVAPWEFYAVATMLVTTHGDEAEMHAAEKLEEAEARNDRGEMVVWGEVIKKLAGIRAEQAQRGE